MKTSFALLGLTVLSLSLSLSAVACAGPDDSLDDGDGNGEDSTDASQTGELSAASIDEGIVINQSILGVKWQASREEVRSSLGKPTTAKNGTDPATGQPTKTYTYGATTFLFFQDVKGTWRVLNTYTKSPKLRTKKGSIGVGSSEKDLKANFPGAKCETIESYRSCTYGGEFFEKHTTFSIDKHGRIIDVFLGAIAD